MATNKMTRAEPDAITEAWRKLTPKQAAFVNAYQRCGNKTESYRIAYPVSREWHSNAVGTEAVRLSNHPAISLLLGDVVATIRDNAREASIQTASKLLRIAEVPEDAGASHKAVAVQALRLLSDQAGVTGQGATVNVQVNNNALDPSAAWNAGGSDAWANRHAAIDAASSVTPDSSASA